MNFKIPYILTFFSLLCYSYLLSAYSYSQTSIGQIYSISTTQFGIIYCISSLFSILGGLVSIYYTIKITDNIVTVFCLANIGFIIPYLIIIGIPIVFEHPHKVFVYIALFVLNFFRAFYFPLVVLMVKKHKDIALIKENIVESNHRLMIMIWSIGYDIGMILGFFVSNWLDQAFNWNWKQLIMIGIILCTLNALLVWIFLKEYLQIQYFEAILEKKTLNIQIQDQDKVSHATTFSTFIKMLKNQPAILLFSINTILLLMKDASYSLILPLYFYKIGYRGKQGYLVAVLSLFVVIGSMMFSLSDFIRSRINHYFDQQNQNQLEHTNQGKNQKIKKNKRNMRISDFIQSPISLFLFFSITLLIAFDSINKTQINQMDAPNYTLQLVYMCLMGLFFGGPANQYFSYQFINVMGELQDIYEAKYMKNQKQQENSGQNELNYSNSCCQSLSKQIRLHKFKISTLYMNLKYILYHAFSMPFYVATFYIIENYTYVLFFLLSIVAFIIFAFDITHNCMTYRQNRVKNHYQQVLFSKQ